MTVPGVRFVEPPLDLLIRRMLPRLEEADLLGLRGTGVVEGEPVEVEAAADHVQPISTRFCLDRGEGVDGPDVDHVVRSDFRIME